MFILQLGIFASIFHDTQPQRDAGASETVKGTFFLESRRNSHWVNPTNKRPKSNQASGVEAVLATKLKSAPITRNINVISPIQTNVGFKAVVTRNSVSPSFSLTVKSSLKNSCSAVFIGKKSGPTRPWNSWLRMYPLNELLLLTR